MLVDFKKYISLKNLFSEKDKILLTVSGGIDSVVMCHLFHLAGYAFAIAHCNFKLRGKESDEDEKFVAALSKKYKVPFYFTSFNTSDYAKNKGISIQMAARELRYNWFEKIRKEKKYSSIATAHHKDDQVETVLINLVRGTGISGLHGILSKQNNIIRPLLFTTRNEIESFAKENKLKYREDSSNASTKYIRNKIRHEVIPVLKEINPNLEKTITDTIERIKGVEEIYNKAIADKKKQLLLNENGKIIIPINAIKNLPSAYLYSILSEYNFNAEVVDEILKSLNGPSGKSFFSATHRLVKDRSNLIITSLSLSFGEGTDIKVVIKKGSAAIEYPVKINLKRISISSPLLRRGAGGEAFKIPVLTSIACLDEGKLQYPLILRKWKEGDYFFPLGMKTKKKLSDFFIDNKFSIVDKERTWLLTSGNDIIWIVGHRIDDRYKIYPVTKKILVCELQTI